MTIFVNSLPVTVFKDHLTHEVIENLQYVGQKEGSYITNIYDK